MTARFVTSADINRLGTLDLGGLADLKADYGPRVRGLTVADLLAYINDPDKVAIAHLRNTTVQGFLLAQQATGEAYGHVLTGWQITRTVIAGTVNQRITGFREATQLAANNRPNAHIWGQVKRGGRLDLFLGPKGYERYDGSSVTPNPIAGEPDIVVPPGDFVYFRATTALVAATI